MASAQRTLALRLIESLKKEYGDAVYSGKKVRETKFVRTSHPLLDYVMGGKGIPIGRITEMYGNEGSGKTSLAIRIASAFQREKGIVVWCDGEKTFDRDYAKRLGLDTDSVVVLEISSGERLITAITKLLKSNEPPSLIVVDSIASITSETEIEAGMDDARPAVNARMWNKAMRIWNATNKNTTILLINQIRYGIGGRGENISVGGGMGIKFHASLRIQIKSGQWIKDGDTVIGHMIRMRSDKNKVTGFPHRSGELQWFYDLRNNYIEELATFAAIIKVVQRSGAWIKFNGKTYQGVAGLKKALEKDKKLLVALEDKVYRAELPTTTFKEEDTED